MSRRLSIRYTPFLPVLAGVLLLAAVMLQDPLAPLGPPPIPPDNPQMVDENGYPIASDPKVELGRVLFYDNRLSGNASISCADCHSVDFGWTDGSDLCRGYTGTSHWRNCQTLINSAYYDKLFWDGSSKSLEAQAASAAMGAVSGNGERDMMEERLRQVPEYVRRFRDVFGTQWPELEDAWRAIAAFERTLIQTDTPYDRYLRGDVSALTNTEVAGLELFRGKAACVDCHNGPLLSDQRFHALGVPENESFTYDALRQITFRYEQYIKGVTEEQYREVKTDLGLYYVTKRTEDMGKFRTPSLRYTVYTAPYMHNGVFYTLNEVVDFYDAGGGPGSGLAPLGLSAEEKANLVAFLESLSGEEVRMQRPDLPPYGVLE